MTKKTKTILFLSLIFLFFLTAPAVVFYSKGYRIDLNPPTGGIKIIQSGGFYFKVWPKNIRVYLNGEFIKKTDVFFGAAYLDNLLPKKYEIEIKKDKYHSWKKSLEITEKQVTDAKNIILMPKNPKFSILAQNTADFFFTPDGRKVLLKEVDEMKFSLKLLDLERDIKSHLIEDKDISKIPVFLSDIKFSPHSLSRILLEIDSEEKLKFFLLDFSKSPINLLFLDFLGEKVETIFFHPENHQKLFFSQNGTIFEVDLVKKEISSKLLENVITWQIFDKNIYYLDNVGFLFKTDFSFLEKEKINEIPFQLSNFNIAKEKQKQIIHIFAHKIFLQDNDNLFLFNPVSKSFEKFFERVKGLKISPDFKKLVYFSNYEIWVLFLSDDFGQPRKSAGEKALIARFSENIEEVFWLSSHYLILQKAEKLPDKLVLQETEKLPDKLVSNSSGKLKVVEIDDRDKINIVDLTHPVLTEGKIEIFFNQTNKKLYIFNQGNLYVSEKLIP